MNTIRVTDQVDYRKRLQLGPRGRRRQAATSAPVPVKSAAVVPASLPPPLKTTEPGQPKSLAVQLREAGVDYKTNKLVATPKAHEVVDFMGGMQKNVAIKQTVQPDQQTQVFQEQIRESKKALRSDDVL